MKCITISWLAKADLSNLNSGQGSGNLTELKTYNYGQKPYVSGQATRTAIFETMRRSYPDKFICTAERPCGDVANCWGCDLRGFLATKEGEGGDRRWSPIKVTPGLGQLNTDIVSDMLTRHSVIEKEDKKSKDQRIAHVQMIENIYKFGLVIDVDNVGKVIMPQKEGKGNEERVVGWKTVVDIGNEGRVERICALLDAIFNLSGFAKQARAATSLAPDVILITIQDTYNQRGLKSLELNDEGCVKLDLLEYGLAEHKAAGNMILFGLVPGIVSNEDEVKNIFNNFGINILRVSQAIEQAKDYVRKSGVVN